MDLTSTAVSTSNYLVEGKHVRSYRSTLTARNYLTNHQGEKDSSSSLVTGEEQLILDKKVSISIYLLWDCNNVERLNRVTQIRQMSYLPRKGAG
jgi:hypothetical protein